MDTSSDLWLLLASRHPLLFVRSNEEDRLLHLLREAAADLDAPLWTWSAVRGLARDGLDPMYGTGAMPDALAFVRDVEGPGVFVFADAHPYLGDPVVVRSLKEASAGAAPGKTIVVTGPSVEVPPELGAAAHSWTLSPPGRAELRERIGRAMRELKDRGFPIELTPSDFDSLVDSLLGVSAREAERLVLEAAMRDGRIAVDDVERVRNAKAQLLSRDGILELVDDPAPRLEEVGGLDRLKDWIATRSLGRGAKGRQLGLDPPRGVLLTGIPGCGKSLVAKALAKTWELPLVLLDPGRLYSKYIGESEGRLGSALAAIEAMAPALLWIDEIEKGFATGGDGDGGVAKRLLGTFLRWLQDRDADVFIVATANDVRSLPPEFLRKGRFDEIFFVDLPDEKARRAIFAVHLERRQQDPTAFDLGHLATLTEGFSGAELEMVVVGALYRAAGIAAGLDQRLLETEIASTVPLSAARAADVAALRSWAQGRAVQA